MPDEDAPLTVWRHVDGPDLYLVRSQRAGIGHYLVDVSRTLEFPNGRCDCIDNEIRIQYRVRNNLEPYRKTCIHVRAVTAALQHARQLCQAAGIEFDPRIIPTYE